MNGSWLLGLGRVIPYLVLTFALMPVQAAALLLRSPAANRIPRFYHRRAAKLLGLNVVSRGIASTARPTLFVSNHTSYLDIEVLGSLLDCSFIAKSDMIAWPVIGWLARLQRSVFIDRLPRNAGDHANEVAQRLAKGDNLVLFPEGTTSDGNRLLPFKSALFKVAEQAAPHSPLTIQPVSVVATALDGMPLGRALRPIYAWYGDMPLLPHAWKMISLGRLTVIVEFHEAFVATGLTRKQLAARCEQEVLRGMARAIRGRDANGHDPHHHDDAHDDAAEGDEIDAAA
jgi:1-acyl-sn-glycerol-3-phosphate acyltransferase